MKGMRLFMHSLHQVTGNLDGAIRVSALPYGIQIVTSFLFAGQMETIAAGFPPAGGAGISASVGLGVVVALFLTLVTSLWVAVAWHRFVLLHEQPAGFVPPFHAGQLGAYFIRSVGYGLMLMAMAMVLLMVVSLLFGNLLSGGNPVLALLITGLVVQVPLVTVAFRLMAALPGAALDSWQDFMAGWRATMGQTGDIAGLALIAVAGNIALGLVGLMLADLRILAVAWDIVAGWFVTMLGASILTTLYGHYIEGRPLRD